MQLNENQTMIRQMARDFAKAKVAPIAAEIDRTGEFPAATVKEMGELGFLGLTMPEAYGGVGADMTSYALVVEEISRVCGSHGLTVAAHNSLGCWPIAALGTEQQKQQFLPPAAAGKSLLSFGLTEAGAGSDAGGTRTTAVQGRRPLGAQRHQDVDHQQPLCRRPDHHRQDRSGSRGQPRHQRLHRARPARPASRSRRRRTSWACGPRTPRR